MQISELEVVQLFGLFDHSVKFHVDERITIIHGPNGVGKTTLLKLLEAVFTSRFDYLQQIEYESIHITFLNHSKLSILRRKTDGGKTPVQLVFSLMENGETMEHPIQQLDARHFRRRFPLSTIEDSIPNLTRYSPEQWLDSSTGEILSLETVLLRYSEVLPVEEFRVARNLPEWLNEILASISVHFIQTQRLMATAAKPRYTPAGRRDTSARITVEDLAGDMARRIQDVLRASGALAASLDRAFPHRLLQAKLPASATEENIRRHYEEQSAYRQRLMDAGLLQPEETLPLQEESLDESERKVLWYYLADVDQKLEVYRDLLERAELFMRIINVNKFLYKRLSINKDRGFVFTNDNGKNVPLSALSSGEQHELVLAYELLFRARGKSLILIDEPELSLHVTWQHKFLDDMKEISKLADLDFLIATHSPSIVYGRTELMVELGEA